MATVFRPRTSMGGVAHSPWRGYNARRYERLYLPVQPALGYERRRARFFALVIFSVLFFGLLLGIMQRLTTTAWQAVPTAGIVRTPVVTVQFTSAFQTPLPPVQPVNAAALPVAEQMPAPLTQPMILVTSDLGYVNVRSGPSVNYDQVGMIASGTRVAVTGRSADGTWWRVSFQGGTGWVFSQLARFDGDSSQVPVAPAP